MRQPLARLAILLCLAAVGAAHAADLPRPDHVLIIVEENQSYDHIIGNPAAPYINRLAQAGALLSNSYAVAHPSQPNYLALFAGSTFDLPDDRCPLALTGENLASALARRSLSFAIYSESMPSAGFTGCASSGNLYARKHNPAVNWQGINLAPEANLPLERLPADFARLPTVAMLIPNQVDDMHDGPSPEAAIRQADTWLRDHVDAYVQWSKSHNSLLILTFDEDDGTAGNRIATFFVGPMVKTGRYGARIDHYSVLRTVAQMYGLQPPGKAAQAAAIFEVWSAAAPAAHK